MLENGPSKKCYTGVDQISTKYAGDSTQHQDATLSREDASHGARCVCRLYPFFSCKMGDLSRLSPLQPCEVQRSSKVLAIAHATMTLLLVARLRLSLKDERKEDRPLCDSRAKTSKFEDELRQASFCTLRAMSSSLQVTRGKKLCDLP